MPDYFHTWHQFIAPPSPHLQPIKSVPWVPWCLRILVWPLWYEKSVIQLYNASDERTVVLQSAEMRNFSAAECGKVIRGNLRNVPQLVFRKLPLDNFPHSAKYPRPSTGRSRDGQIDKSRWSNCQVGSRISRPVPSLLQVSRRLSRLPSSRRFLDQPLWQCGPKLTVIGISSSANIRALYVQANSSTEVIFKV